MDLFSILDSTPEPPIVDLHLNTINDSGVYDLPTPMFEFQKELTDQIVSLHYPDILKYCETNDTAELIIKSLEICVDNCMLVATHPYLLIQHFMPKNFGLRDIPAKLAETSGKFSVLRDLINVILSNSALSLKNIGVVMKNDSRLFDLTESLMHGCVGPKVIQRYVGNNIKKDSGKAKNTRDWRQNYIHLIPGDGNLSKNESELKLVKFDVIVSLDGYVNSTSEFFQTLRQQNHRGDNAAVLIRLVPMNSIEHCLLHYDHCKDDPTYLYKLISSIVCLRDTIGNLPPDFVPIYNQNLTYLSRTFFDQVFRSDTRSFPPWPLPELPNVPKFSATDVERSLLTEVVFHYTPYDSNEPAADSTKKTKSYYETKRLQLDYVTNPLKNDYNMLSGIHNHHEITTKPSKDRTILSHKLLLELNAGYLGLAVVQEEFNAYVNMNKPDHERRVGRRVADIKKSLSAIMDDVYHAEQRVHVTEQKTIKRIAENEELEEAIKSIESKLPKFAEDHSIDESSSKKKFIDQQLKIWELQKSIKEFVQKLQSKGEERSYMMKEVANCTATISQTKVQETEVEQGIDELKRKIASAYEHEETEAANFKRQKAAVISKIEAAQKENDLLKAKLGKTLKFLKDTSHLKKRKGRGLTPTSR